MVWKRIVAFRFFFNRTESLYVPVSMFTTIAVRERASGWPESVDPGNDIPFTIVSSLRVFEEDMGAVRNLDSQLNMDLVRSLVTFGGERVYTARQLNSRTSVSRFCTQASFAPVVQWFATRGYMLMERRRGGSSPVRIEVNPRHVVLRKALDVGHACSSPPLALQTVLVELHLDATRQTASVSVRGGAAASGSPRSK